LRRACLETAHAADFRGQLQGARMRSITIAALVGISISVFGMRAEAGARGGVFTGTAEDSSKARAEDLSRANAKLEAAKALGTLATNYDKPDKVSTDCVQVDSSTSVHEKAWSCTTHWVIND